jgi:hypothetical protein
VDGEIGRFRFAIHDVVDSEEKVLFHGYTCLPQRHGKAYYGTVGFKEISMIYGTVRQSYRNASSLLNRIRQQEVGGTPTTTLRDATEAEGEKISNFLKKKSDRLLLQAGFSREGMPSIDNETVKRSTAETTAQEETDRLQGRPDIDIARQKVTAEMTRLGMSDAQKEEMEKNLKEEKYERAEEVINIHVDGVGVKKQKETRVKPSQKRKEELESHESKKKKRETVQNIVAHVEWGERGYTLSGSAILQVMLFVLAALLDNGIAHCCLRCFTDGERCLKEVVVGLFAWHKGFRLLLDWHHLPKKCKEKLSSACNSKEARNRHAKQLISLLWFGLVDSAIAYIQAIPPSEIKSRTALNELIGYLERNRTGIPCYAMRRHLHLRNSSNPAERSNNLVTARRQKNNGMSWSTDGSHGLTALTTLVVNGQQSKWLHEREITYEFKKAA